MNNLKIYNIYEEVKRNDKNHIETPKKVVEQIFDLINIKNYNNIWFPFDNYDSEFKLKADELNLNYINTHLFDDNCNDFFTINPPKNCDLLISNPPFDSQNEILKKCFELIDSKEIKSFCLLLPLATLETPKRGNLYNKYYDKLNFIIFKKRIHFKNRRNSFRSGCCWVCYNIPEIKNKIMWI